MIIRPTVYVDFKWLVLSSLTGVSMTQAYCDLTGSGGPFYAYSIANTGAVAVAAALQSAGAFASDFPSAHQLDQPIELDE